MNANDLTRFSPPDDGPDDEVLAAFYDCEPNQLTEYMRDNYAYDLADQLAEERAERWQR